MLSQTCNPRQCKMTSSLSQNQGRGKISLRLAKDFSWSMIHIILGSHHHSSCHHHQSFISHEDLILVIMYRGVCLCSSPTDVAKGMVDEINACFWVNLKHHGLLYHPSVRIMTYLQEYINVIWVTNSIILVML